MSQKPRILIVTDTPIIDSGMGVAHHHIATHLYNSEKYEVASFGWFWSQAQQRGLAWTPAWKQFSNSSPDKPYGHPIGWPNPTQKQIIESPLYQVIDKMFRPDIVIGIGDYWMLDFVYKFPNRHKFKFIHEIPIDGEPIPKTWVKDLKTADVLISMSEYGKRVIQDVDRTAKVTVLPRGVDTITFNQMNTPKSILRKQYMPSAEGRFVVGVFDRYSDRKQIGRAIEAFTKFISDGKHEDCDLYLHMDLHDPHSINQQKNLDGEDGLIQRYGIRPKVIINQHIKVEKGVLPYELNALYNCCDVKLSTTQGEGWGLTTAEAMACGLPCIGTNFTTLPELLGTDGTRGLLADVKTHITGMYNIERALVDTAHVAQLLDRLYRSPNLRHTIGANAKQYIRQFRWDTVMKRWMRLIDETLEPRPYRLIDNDGVKLEKSKDIDVSGAVRENTGWAITTRGISKALKERGWNIHISEGGGRSENFKLTAPFETMMKGEVSRNIAFINHMPPHCFDASKKSTAKYKMIYFPFELDYMIANIVGNLNRLSDVYVCPSKFVENTAKKSGVLNTAVIPLASDIDTKAKLIDLKTKKNYKFLMLGNLGDPRKNLNMVLRAYMTTFTNDDNVTLILKAMPGYPGSDPTEQVDAEILGRKNPPEVKVIHNDDNDIASYYASCDCLLFPSFCEGWGHPVFEALKFGMPVIASNYGGYLDFIHRGKNIQLISGEVELASKSPQYKAHEKWFVPDFTEFSCAMRKAEAFKIRKTGIDYVADYTWDKTAEAIENIYKTKIRKEPKVKVYYERMIKNLWNSDNENGFKNYAPVEYEFVTEPKYADFQILDVTRISDKYNLRCDKYIIFFHCFGEWSEEPASEYHDLFKDAMLVYSHIDLAPTYPILPKAKFMRGAWGSQPDFWFKNPGMNNDKFEILCTGEIASTEGIRECVLACDAAHKKLLHIGQNFKYQNYSYTNMNNLSVAEMREAYNISKWVSALRRTEGFEKPAIEGLLCGARPICFDTPLYKYWYGDLARYVKEGLEAETFKDILKVMKEQYSPVTLEEKERAIKKFAWFYVAQRFWKRVSEIRGETCR